MQTQIIIDIVNYNDIVPQLQPKGAITTSELLYRCMPAYIINIQPIKTGLAVTSRYRRASGSNNKGDIKDFYRFDYVELTPEFDKIINDIAEKQAKRKELKEKPEFNCNQKSKKWKTENTKKISIYNKIIMQNACKELKIPIHEYKEWNGYGMEIMDKYIYATPGTLKKINEIVQKKEVKKAPRELLNTEEKIIERWAKRLSKLTGISLEEATEIAEEKLEYKEDKIAEMIKRDNLHSSVRRYKLIKKMERENPLRRIEDKEHAYVIIGASNRHRYSNYDTLLDEAHQLEAIGEIKRGTAKEYAHQNLNRH